MCNDDRTRSCDLGLSLKWDFNNNAERSYTVIQQAEILVL